MAAAATPKPGPLLELVSVLPISLLPLVAFSDWSVSAVGVPLGPVVVPSELLWLVDVVPAAEVLVALSSVAVVVSVPAVVAPVVPLLSVALLPLAIGCVVMFSISRLAGPIGVFEMFADCIASG